jgi:glycosyltransferase involved in cell wall biosynthesis
MARVLVRSLDVIGKEMAGPGIRSWEFAKHLANSHDVTLGVPNQPDVRASDFRIVRERDDRLISANDVVVTQVITPRMARIAKGSGTRFILDAYDPVVLENLERYSSRGAAEQHRVNEHSRLWHAFSLLAADSVICASEVQRDLWLGFLLSLGRISPELYHRDATLRSFIDVVPFGLPSATPVRGALGLRQRFGLSQSDFVVLWAGGVWDWLDPLTPIEAVAQISRRFPDIKLVFMGLRHPNPAIGEMTMSRRALDLADSLGVTNKSVFFNHSWVPYGERASYLLDADIGISAHFDHLEARYAFRTRVLDYIWCELPILCTKGDAFAREVEERQVGFTVAPRDVGGFVAALDAMRRPDASAAMRARLTLMKAEYQWDTVARVLEQHVSASALKTNVAPRRRSLVASYYIANVKEHRARYGVRHLATSVALRTFWAIKGAVTGGR